MQSTIDGRLGATVDKDAPLQDAKRSHFEGYIDFLSGTHVHGWAWLPDDPQAALVVTVTVADLVVARGSMDEFRPDLFVDGVRSGRNAFTIGFPFDIASAALPLLEFTVAAERSSDSRTVGHLSNPVPRNGPARDIGLLAPIIDVDFYAACQGLAAVLSDCVAHYGLRGRFQNARPNPLFDPSCYRLAREAEGLPAISDDALIFDFLGVGQALGLRPHPLFDIDLLIDSRPELKRDGALQTFLESSNSSTPLSLLWWPEWYAKRYAIDGDPLTHYLTLGEQSGFSPNPLFDAGFYADAHTVPKAHALRHYFYIGDGIELSPHPLVDFRHVKSQLRHVHRYSSRRSLLELFMANNDLSPHPLFDTAYYLSRQPAAVADTIAVVDYLERPADDLYPHPMFSNRTYLESRPDVRRSGTPPLLHYLASGFTEQVEVHPLLDHRYVREQIDEGATPALLTLSTTQQPGTIFPRMSQPIEERVNQLWNPIAFNLSANSESGAPTFVDGRPHVGLFAHVFYTDLQDEICLCANNLPDGSRVFISTDTFAKSCAVTEYFRANCRHVFEVRIVPNRGRDIAPLIVSYADRIREVDLCLHLHTKKSKHYGQAFDGWRRYLFRNLAGSATIVDTILGCFEDPQVGAVAPLDFAPIRQLINWGGNRPMVRALTQLLGHDIRNSLALELPSGSMFWFRSKALAPLLDLGLTLEFFDPEVGQVDGTLAHAIERAFFFVVEIAGFGWVRTTLETKIDGITVTGDLDAAISRISPSAAVVPSAIESYAPETVGYAARRSSSVRPRLNILLPTCDTSVGYAGVSEALRIYRYTLQLLGPDWDGRIVATDVPIGKMFDPPEGHRLVDSFRAGETGRAVVVDGSDKRSEFMPLRDGDVFMASAWWNAMQVFKLIEAQRSMFPHGSGPRKLVYLVQDDETGFNAWSVRSALCADTYRRYESVIPVFNTPLLAEHFPDLMLRSSGLVYKPPINETLRAEGAVVPDDQRENIVLLYARPHAQRNAFEFIDAVVEACLRHDASHWRGWRWLAIGENFAPSLLRGSTSIEVAGRLTLPEYRAVLRKARLGLSIMISPHPSYPPLEMAEHGMRVITNRFKQKNLSSLHEGIWSFDTFDPDAVARQIKEVSLLPSHPRQAKVDWFFGGRSNVWEVCGALAARLGAGDAAARSSTAA